MTAELRAIALVVGPLACATFAMAAEPWIVTTQVALTEPTEVEDVIVATGGELRVVGVGDPGFGLSGNLWVVGTGRVVIEDSVVEVRSSYHGQYTVVAAEHGEIEVRGCDYRVTPGIQHALVAAGDGRLTVTDTDFGDAQLIAGDRAELVAERLTGNFEVIALGEPSLELADIPRQGGEGSIWVWVEFGEGSEAVYTPPAPGRIEAWDFPPAGATGISQRIEVRRCEVRLWPMLVWPSSRLELRDIPESSWVVVGLHLPEDARISGLRNGAMPDGEVALDDRTLTLTRASVDTWNLYPELDAVVTVRDSVLGEILAQDDSKVRVHDSVVDGSGGFLGARHRSEMVLRGSRVTCTVEAAQDARLELHSSEVAPYPIDVGGRFTRIGAYDTAVLYAADTEVTTLPALGGAGLIAASWIGGVPQAPPGPGVSSQLWGVAAMFSLEGGPAPGRWRLDALARQDNRLEPIGAGDGNLEEAPFGTWQDADPTRDYLLRLTMVDAWGRVLTAGVPVPREGDRQRAPAGRRLPAPAASQRAWRQLPGLGVPSTRDAGLWAQRP